MIEALDLSLDRNRNLVSILAARAEHSPDTRFLVSGDRSVTYAEAYAATESLAGGLRAQGIVAGDRVAIIMAPESDYVQLVIAINRLGAVWVPINPDYRGSWLAEAILSSEPAAIVANADLAPRLTDAIGDVPDLLIIFKGEAADFPRATVNFDELRRHDPPPDVSIFHGDTAAVLWTSGTTGRPKGVMQSHNAWVKAAISSAAIHETRPGDVIYSCLPLYNSAAWCAAIFPALIAGVTVAIDDHFSVRNFWNRIRHYGATQAMSLGAMHMFLWNAPACADDADNPLRTAMMVPMAEDVIEPFCRRFGIESIVQGYGQSEVLTLLQRRSEPGRRGKPNALGTSADLEIRLLDDDGIEVPVGTVGEFAIRPPGPFHLFNGYFNNPEATAAAFVGDWFRTGDLGRMDEDGDFFFVDRKKDLIRYMGRSVSSFQVEQVAAAHPDVAQCAAFGIPSAELASEDEIKLDVVPKEGTSIGPAELARFINDNAPFFLVPRYIEIVNELPYTPTNKVEKYKLRARGVGKDTWDRRSANFELVR